MTNLRLFGIIVGIILVLFSVIYYRGVRWKKFNFFFALFFGFILIIVSVNPSSINFIENIFSLDIQYARVISLFILSIIILFFMFLYLKTKHDDLKFKFDYLIRGLGIQNLAPEDVDEKIFSAMVIIPAYNEAENLEILLPQIPEQVGSLDLGVVVVDDGSTDATGEVAHKHGALVIKNVINRGQGASSRAGYDLLKAHGVKIGVTMDADNQHSANDIQALVQPILDDRFDLVIGSRMLGSHSGDSLFRSFGVNSLSKLISLMIGQTITDCSSGFKAFQMEKMTPLRFIEDQFQSAEVLIVSAKEGLRIGEVPIHIHTREHGQSKKGPNSKYGVLFTKVMLKTWLR